jgi:hypothetical protein
VLFITTLNKALLAVQALPEPSSSSAQLCLTWAPYSGKACGLGLYFTLTYFSNGWTKSYTSSLQSRTLIGTEMDSVSDSKNIANGLIIHAFVFEPNN